MNTFGTLANAGPNDGPAKTSCAAAFQMTVPVATDETNAPATRPGSSTSTAGASAPASRPLSTASSMPADADAVRAAARASESAFGSISATPELAVNRFASHVEPQRPACRIIPDNGRGSTSRNDTSGAPSLGGATSTRSQSMSAAGTTLYVPGPVRATGMSPARQRLSSTAPHPTTCANPERTAASTTSAAAVRSPSRNSAN